MEIGSKTVKLSEVLNFWVNGSMPLLSFDYVLNDIEGCKAQSAKSFKNVCCVQYPQGLKTITFGFAPDYDCTAMINIKDGKCYAKFSTECMTQGTFYFCKAVFAFLTKDSDRWTKFYTYDRKTWKFKTVKGEYLGDDFKSVEWNVK